ncbi:hypothetical protein CYMTET_38403 [Cymbomonas tetramitiformis]|uniref:Uncharacterized protein n=1 Tax=Cymbomonas tetramitiformis TaxID=36881 RepID=A0AAE0CC29_9CHLO|nr:hypothetical protein CYMTET_38403 [Cymbomonas tetramitiformis]
MDPDLGWTRKTYDHLTERKTAQDLQLKVQPGVLTALRYISAGSTRARSTPRPHHAPPAPHTLTLSWPAGRKEFEPHQVPPERSPSEDATRSSAQSYRKMRAWMEREVGAAKERTETLEEQLRIARREIAATSDEAQLVREDAEAAEARAEVALSLQKNVRWQ